MINLLCISPVELPKSKWQDVCTLYSIRLETSTILRRHAAIFFFFFGVNHASSNTNYHLCFNGLFSYAIDLFLKMVLSPSLLS